MKQNRNEMQAIILAAAQSLGWLLRYPENPESYPQEVATCMVSTVHTLAPLASGKVDRAISWLISYLWQKVNREMREDEEEMVLFETDHARRPDETLRLMGQEIEVDAEQLALRLPFDLRAWVALSGEALLTIGQRWYGQVLFPALAPDAGVDLVCFEVPVSEQHRAVLRGLGATESPDGHFVTLTSREQRMRMALASASSAIATLHGWELSSPPGQAGGSTGTGIHLYRWLNASGGGWQPWLSWAIAMRSTDYPPEEPWSDRISSTRRVRRALSEQSPFMQRQRELVDRECGDEEGHRRQQEEESGPFGHLRRTIIEGLARAAYQQASPAGYRTVVRNLEVEGALSRWERVLENLRSSIGELATEGLRLDTPSGIAMLAAALTGRNELVMQSAGATAPLRPSMPAQMFWVWGIPIEDLETADRVQEFMHFADIFKLADRYALWFVQPDGKASTCPVLYGITNAEQAQDQLHWLATGDGNIPL